MPRRRLMASSRPLRSEKKKLLTLEPTSTPAGVAHEGLGPAPTAGRARSAGRSDLGRFAAARSYDVKLGAGLVAAFCALVAGTSFALSPTGDTRQVIVIVVIGVAVADAGLFALRWDRYPRRMLLAFPLLLLMGEVVLALATRGVAADYG